MLTFYLGNILRVESSRPCRAYYDTSVSSDSVLSNTKFYKSPLGFFFCLVDSTDNFFD